MKKTSFNPRACGRRDVFRAQNSKISLSFNPRACGRRDSTFVNSGTKPFMFQSTRLREARLNIDHYADWSGWFQSTRLREARLLPLIMLLTLGSFNPRACGRRDLAVQYSVPFALRFNPRACGRRDLTLIKLILMLVGFNPRACGRRDSPVKNSNSRKASFNPRACGRRDLKSFL
ncbi:hypothetical protein PPEP_b1139 [Pseudoalteromonas peptidolytica F12-50-A1]|uniref:Uncharacterized protein n=1 Tax=Pseudoalteromonas peptidolytica F12-50-A1 TaxID=1315280 RepID=A0A8I0N1E6_9GAMM|nr:hypothetical protein [Pseudoalteromonas peptidolytica F12-50-A1]